MSLIVEIEGKIRGVMSKQIVENKLDGEYANNFRIATDQCKVG